MDILKKSSISTSTNLNSKEEASIIDAFELYILVKFFKLNLNQNSQKILNYWKKDFDINFNKEYIDSMLEKLEKEGFATYIGNGVAIPHGMESGKQFIKKTGISYIQCPQGVEWNGETAYIIVGIAAKNDEHLDVLATLAELIEDPDDAKQLWNIEDIELIYEKFKI